MAGERWKNQYGWLIDVNECDWKGIGCDSVRNIVSIELPENGIGGTLPTELGMLVELQAIDFSSNDISGSLPLEMGALTALEALYLFANAIAGPVFNMSRLETLRYLYLGETLLTVSHLADDLSSLSRLEVLDLSFMLPPHGVYSAVTGLPTLRVLNLIGHDLDGSIPESLRNMTSLEYVNLGDCKLTGTIPSWIGDMKKLRAFSAGSNFLEGTIPANLGANPLLKIFDVSDNGLVGTIPSEMAMCTDLEFLNIHSTSITGTIPFEFRSLNSLQALQIACTKIQESDFPIGTFCTYPTGISAQCESEPIRFANCPCCITDTFTGMCPCANTS